MKLDTRTRVESEITVTMTGEEAAAILRFLDCIKPITPMTHPVVTDFQSKLRVEIADMQQIIQLLPGRKEVHNGPSGL